MKISEFDYFLDKNLIAQEPREPRDHSRLLILNRKNKKIIHTYFYKIINYLSEKDVLVLNNTRVIPAKLIGKIGNKEKEILLVKPFKEKISFKNWPDQWYVLGKKLKVGKKIIFSKELEGEIIKKIGMTSIILFNKKGGSLKKLISKIGLMPLPPYIKRPTKKSFDNYQTVYAKYLGSIAAPTAGFHFTKKLLKKIKAKGVQIEYITLNIGLGTFLPIKTQNVEEHQMEKEFFILSKNTALKLNKAKEQGKRIIAVGTTVTRVLESCSINGKLKPQKKYTDLFIYPGYQFKFIDALITNFHLPKSTPLLLVCAFASKELIFKAYQEAIKRKYRFYSFGDAMFII